MKSESERLKILIFIDHDIIIRHFVHSGVFRRLIEKHDVRFVFPNEDPQPRRVLIDLSSLGMDGKFERLALHQKRQALWTKLMHVSALRWTPGIRGRTVRDLTKSAIGKGHVREYTRLALPGFFAVFKWCTLRNLRRNPYWQLEELIERERPDFIIHPTVLAGYFINDLVQVSKTRRIPLLAIMNSWDNPSLKKAMVGCPDWLLVWGPQTKEHAIRYAGIPAEKVVMFGSAQFEVYKEPAQIDRVSFRRQMDLSPDTRLLLYAGSSKETDEYSHLLRLEAAIDQGLLPNVVILYRPHPWGNCGHEGQRIGKHLWRHVMFEPASKDYVLKIAEGINLRTTPDYRHTRETLANVDAVISPLSTILLEAALVGKPSLCLLPDEEGHALHYKLVRDMVHFKEFFESPEFLLAYGADKLVSKAIELLARAEDRETPERLKKAAAFFVLPFDKPYGERLSSFVEQQALKAKRTPASNSVLPRG